VKRSKSYFLAEATRADPKLNERQIAGIQTALKEADAGDFASEDEVEAVMERWQPRRAR
jgi:RHH-type transcriptional regulator, rel operon repressor / antitoxin RelB